MNAVLLDGRTLSLKDIALFSFENQKSDVCIHPDCMENVQQAKNYIAKKVETTKVPIYGVNTGFGAFANKSINKDQIRDLQYNLIRSHCTGVGEPFSPEITKAILGIRANCLTQGHSGVHPEIINLLVDFLNHDITPIVPQKGSVGASGDLAPLAQVALCLIGEGEVWFKGKKVPSDFAIEQIGKKPIELHAKEGLSLINGTAVMSALAAYACYHMQTLVKSADIISALTLDALEGSIKAFNPAISQLKPHPGQLEVCSNLNRLLEHSEIINSHANCGKVQDPYSLRCIPQVHGAIRQTLRHTIEVLETEINSVTDNPLIFPEQDLVLSGGNFHGQAIAFALDYLGMGLSEIVSISERRIEKMMNPTFSNLPPFLIEDGGLNSGLMIAQVTAAALVSDSKFLSNTASTDSVPTSTDKEDHVSMGVTAGRKLIPMIENAYQCLAIELLCATQALHFNKEYRTSPALEAVRSLVLNHSPFLKKDQVLNKTIVDLEHLIQSKNIISKAEQICGPLS